ncbi:MAG: hypothetical protein JXR41_00130 [Bacteroidales bacterium]|nr:hypothetical protein [Bacteroidales bacterium]MBN2761465.1 hypothetical protein [Bacteroidales bacterium]
MKKILIILSAILYFATGSGQAPEGFNYQAALRDASGNLLAGTDVSVQISIIQGSTTGTQVFTETHNTKTNGVGLINLQVGSVNTTDLGNIDWSAGPYYIKLAVNGTEMGTSQLLSVPYALYAAHTDNLELSVSGYDLSITGGNIVTLPIQDTMWKKDNNLVYTDYSVGVGTANPSRKLHIQVDSNGLNIPLMVHNLDETESGGNAVGIGFNNEPGGGWVKAAIAHERTAYYGTGTMHFLLDNTADDSDVTLSDSKMSITREGNVGFGITDPKVKLHFNGPFIFGTDKNMPGFGTSSVLNTNHGLLYQGGGDNWAHHFVAYSTGDIVRFGNSTGVNDEPDIKAVIDNNGNLGLGTAYPDRKLHITVDNNGLNIPLMVHNLDETETGGNAVGIGFNNEPGGGWVKAAIALERTASYGTGTLHFLMDNTADDSDVTLSDSKMSITRNGNVGIGTTIPHSKLQVTEGDVYVETIGSGIILKASDGSCWRITVGTSGALKTTLIGCP